MSLATRRPWKVVLPGGFSHHTPLHPHIITHTCPVSNWVGLYSWCPPGYTASSETHAIRHLRDDYGYGVEETHTPSPKANLVQAAARHVFRLFRTNPTAPQTLLAISACVICYSRLGVAG